MLYYFNLTYTIGVLGRDFRKLNLNKVQFGFRLELIELTQKIPLASKVNRKFIFWHDSFKSLKSCDEQYSSNMLLPKALYTN